MNPAGIPVFYGAFDEATCVAELRPWVSGTIVTCGFGFHRPVRLLDLTATSNPEVVVPLSMFAEDFAERFAHRKFIESFEDIVARPVQPHESEIAFVPTQMVAEYVGNALGLDGVIYKSSQLGAEASNLVIIVGDDPPSRETVGPLLAMTMSPKVWRVTAISYVTEEEDEGPFAILGSLAGLADVPNAWNRNQVEFMALVTHPNLDHEPRVHRLWEVFRRQIMLIALFEQRAQEVADSELREALLGIVGNYRERLRQLNDMVTAAVAIDEDSFDAALAGYHAVSTPRVVLPLVARVYEHLRLSGLLQAQGVDLLTFLRLLGQEKPEARA